MSDSFWVTLPILIPVVVSAIVSIINTFKLNIVHKQINSRMDQLLLTTASHGKAEGQLESQKVAATMILDAAKVAQELLNTAKLIALEKIQKEN